MPRNPFSRSTATASMMLLGSAKQFLVFPTSSALKADADNIFPTDEDGIVRVWNGDIASAITMCVAGRGDKIYLAPGTYTVSTALAMSVADVSLIGLGSPGQAVITGSAADCMDITASGCSVSNITFNIASTKIAIDMNGASNCQIYNNVFLSAVGGASSYFIRMATAVCNYNWIHDNRFISNLVVAAGAITQTAHILGLGIGNIIEHNAFVAGRVTTDNAGAVSTGVLFGAAADAGNLIRWNSFTEFNGATFTAGVDYGTTALGGSVMCYDNNFMLATAANAVVNGSNAANFANNIASGTV